MVLAHTEVFDPIFVQVVQGGVNSLDVVSGRSLK